MRIWINERVVERCTDPSSPDYQKVIKQYTKTLFSFMSEIIPRVGEIFYIDENTAYDVINVIYSFSDTMNIFRSVTLEVAPHVEKHKYETRNCSYEEPWPLVMNIETTQDWLNKASKDKSTDID